MRNPPHETAVFEITVVLPPVAEQRKIACILNRWDQALDTVKALVTAKTERLTPDAVAALKKKQEAERAAKVVELCMSREPAATGSERGRSHDLTER